MAEEPRGTILVVDDEEALADLYSEFLDDAGYDVRTAYNGGDAIVKIDESVDVVLLDRQMPEIQGAEVLAKIRQWLDWCRVVIVTAQEPDFDVADLPFDEYLTKPVDEETLLDTVDQMFLLDEYDELLNEFRSITSRYALLKSHKNQAELEDSEEFAELERRRAESRQRLPELIAEFTDPAFAEAFEQLHGIEGDADYDGVDDIDGE
jgi:CheY-like chemotaxis protein